ncbi:MAG: hypothetical protein ACTSU5_18305 [Promethearchaeota archaeon]
MEAILRKMTYLLDEGRSIPKEHLLAGVQKILLAIQSRSPAFVDAHERDLEALEVALNRGRASRVLRALEDLANSWGAFVRDEEIKAYNQAKKLLWFQFTKGRDPRPEETVELGFGPEDLASVNEALVDLLKSGEPFLQPSTEVERKAFAGRVSRLAHSLVRKYGRDGIIKGVSLPFLVTREGFSFNEARAVGEYLVSNGLASFFTTSVDEARALGIELLRGETSELSWDEGPKSQLVAEQSLGEDFVPIARDSLASDILTCPSCQTPLSEDLKRELERESSVICETCGIRIELK